MIKIISIAKYDLLKLAREKSTLPVLILMPIILTFVMGLAMGNGSANEDRRIPVGISNHDSGIEGKRLLAEAGKDKTIKLIEYNENELVDKVKNANIEIGFIIPEDFSKNIVEAKAPEIKVFKLPSSVDFMAIEGIISSAYAKIKAGEGTKIFFEEKLNSFQIPERNKKTLLDDISEKVEANLEKPSLISVEASRYSGKSESVKYDGKAQNSLGFAVMFVMFTLIMSAGEILDEKKNNTWGRLGITPTGKGTIMLGKVLGTFLRGWVQLLFLILFGRFAMGVSWGNSLLTTVILMSVYLLSVTSMGLLLASLVKTNAQLGALSTIFVICTSMLSGCMWPADIMSPAMQKFSAIFPQYWAMKGLMSTVVGNLGLSSITTPLLVLALMGIAFFLMTILSGGLKMGIRKAAPAKAISGEQAQF
ncbi:MAG: ABC transporter permease [Clostridia bacterium]|nr:ABC transporter permease [Clostridia bacterium]